MKNRLFYTSPAHCFEEALPVGNGRLGGMVYGGICAEHIGLNEDTLWSCVKAVAANPLAKAALPDARRAIMEGRLGEAQDIITQSILCDWGASFLPLGDLLLEMPLKPDGETETYIRELDLDHAVCVCRFTNGGIRYVREVFCSFPAQLLIVRTSCDAAGGVNLRASLTSPLRSSCRVTGDALALSGQCPLTIYPDYFPCEEPIVYGEGGIRFEARLQAVAQGGCVTYADAGIEVLGADSVTLLLAAGTSFIRFDAPADANPADACRATLAAAAGKDYETLLREHIDDYRPRFARVSIDLGPEPDLPTDERLVRLLSNESDSALLALQFQYGRYLLLACSREHSQPANLQGVWNKDLRPAWSSNYTVNINTQMNYWSALPCNLEECQQPLFEMIGEIAQSGAATAEECYGCRGWACHHNVDLWRTSVPMGRLGESMGFSPVRFGMWPMAGPWLCRHLWEHYLFTLDEAFLAQTAYPLMRGSAEFLLDWLVEMPDGTLGTCPSISPENEYRLDGQPRAASISSTMDISLIRELFRNCLQAARRLPNSDDDDFQSRLEDALKRLAPIATTADGRIMEWSDDYEENEPLHRHISHLYALYPSNTMPEALYDACRASLIRRGDDGTGWGLVWKANAWARLGDGNRALSLLLRQMRITESKTVNYSSGGIYPNLLAAHPPFQIDANLGFPSVVAEMLLQSHKGELCLLPALPSPWRDGYVRGLLARGGYQVDIQWRQGRLERATIRARRGGSCAVRYEDLVQRRNLRAGEAWQYSPGREEGI